ncbi:MAG: hypothetical protein ACKN81_15705, partial [Pirellulaceae bacterium]
LHQSGCPETGTTVGRTSLNQLLMADRFRHPDSSPIGMPMQAADGARRFPADGAPAPRHLPSTPSSICTDAFA